VFFFEKKNQKTFSPAPHPPGAPVIAERGAKRVKVFWFLFSKNSASFFLVFRHTPPT
jgi:hypothetical protein